MQESRLYLIFEFLSMDLKKYLDSIPTGQYMDPMLVKVSQCEGGLELAVQSVSLFFFRECVCMV